MKSGTPVEVDIVSFSVMFLTWVECVLQHAQAPEEAGLQRPALWQEEGLAGSERDQ